MGSSSSAAAAGAAQAQPHAGAQQYEMGTNSSSSRRLDWKPRQGVLVASLREHGGAVNRLALSQDQAFFVSASADGTCKVRSPLFAASLHCRAVAFSVLSIVVPVPPSRARVTQQ